MQQPLPQHDQITAQQIQQQMVLCPVRVVYETQILVQPGDQIQPNQTLFINPQNPPPWAQSRPVQNQVIYVQQMPGNIVPSLPQHMDQNQLYLHQYPGYQQGVQMIPQQMVQSMQERQNSIQMPNLIHQNMISNYHTNLTSNLNQNIQLPDRAVQQANYAQIHQNVGANMQIQPQIALASNNIGRSNDAATNTQNQVQQNQFNAQKVEMKPTYLAQVQTNQTANIGRSQPQVLTVNPIQNMPQTSNVQTFAPSIVRPIKTESVGSQITPPTYVNAAQNTQLTRIRKAAPTNSINRITPAIGIRNVAQTQTYRPIQPRPIQQFRATLPNYSTLEPLGQGNSMPLLNQNIININSTLPIQNVQNVSANTVSFVRTEDLNVNRKRKSESPDEIHKKMAAIQVNITAPTKQVIDNAKRSSEIGVNTSPLQNNQVPITPSILQPNNMKIDIIQPPVYNNLHTDGKNISYVIQNVQPPIKSEQPNVVKPTLEPIEMQSNIPQSTISNSTVTDKDKLIRNTVYPQARGRVLTDKELGLVTEPKNPEPVTILKEITITAKDPNVKPNYDIKPEICQPQAIDIVKSEIKTGKVKEENKDHIKKEVKDIKKESKKEEIKEEKKERADMKVTLNTTNNKGMFPVERAVKQEKDYILTHVLDGIVIQESNVAFPIREPLIKRISQYTAQVFNEAKDIENDAKSIGETTVNETSQISERSTETGVAQGDNPFLNLSTATVKSWTTQQLSSHLSAQGWDDTASLFVEHEIDGESLYLVSKAQLQTIGVKEEQADVICAFVKS